MRKKEKIRESTDWRNKMMYVTEEQEATILKLKERQYKKYKKLKAKGEDLLPPSLEVSFKFGGGIGISTVVRCGDEELDVTDYGTW